MSRFFIHTVNSDFQSRDDGADYSESTEALAAGVRSALGIAVDEVCNGRASTAVEVSVEREAGTPLLRSIVAVSVSSLSTNVGAAAVFLD